MSSNQSNDQLGALLASAGKKLGVSPDVLRAALNDPKKAQSLIGELDQKTGGKLSGTDPSSLEKVVNSNPKAKKLFDDIMRGGKNG